MVYRDNNIKEQLDAEDAQMFMEELGIEEGGLARLIRAAYGLLGLQSYFTNEMPPPLQVMTALMISFVVGIGLSMVTRGVMRK